MAVALKRFYQGDIATCERELNVFRSCNDKLSKLLKWSNEDDRSIDDLRELALSRGGLYNAAIRQKAWPALLGTQRGNEPITGSSSSTDLELMRRDVQRSALFRSTVVAGSVVKGEQRFEDLQNKLLSVLDAALCTSTDAGDRPSYYQGLHDVAFVLLHNLTFDEVLTTAALQKILRTNLRDASKKDFRDVTFVLDSFLLPMIRSFDPELHQVLVDSDVPLTNAVLPWVITLFAHPVHDGAVASRIMDAFLSESDPMMPVYVAAALLLHPASRQQLMDEGYDPVMMHLAIQGLPAKIKNDFAEGEDGAVRAQDLIDFARAIMKLHSSESLVQSLISGLPKRSRRRMQKRVRRIHMLRQPSPVMALKLTAQQYVRESVKLCRDTAANAASAFTSAASEMSSKVQATMNDVGKETVALYEATKSTIYNEKEMIRSALQVLALFVLMPRNLSALQILALFVLVPKNITMRCSSALQGIVGPESTQLESRSEGEEDLPCMVKSPSTQSFGGSNHNRSYSALSDELDASWRF